MAPIPPIGSTETATSKTQNYFDILPEELLLKISRMLPVFDLISLSLTNRKNYRIMNDYSIWYDLLKKDFNGSETELIIVPKDKLKNLYSFILYYEILESLPYGFEILELLITSKLNSYFNKLTVEEFQKVLDISIINGVTPLLDEIIKCPRFAEITSIQKPTNDLNLENLIKLDELKKQRSLKAAKMILRNDNAKNINSFYLGKFLIIAVLNDDMVLFNLICHHPNYKEIISDDLNCALPKACFDLEMLNLILHHPRREKITFKDLENSLCNVLTILEKKEAIKPNFLEILKLILQHPNSKDIRINRFYYSKIEHSKLTDVDEIKKLLLFHPWSDTSFLGEFLCNSIMSSDKEEMNMILSHPISERLPSGSLGRAFCLVCGPSIYSFELANRILQYPNSKNISTEYLGRALIEACSINLKIVNLILSHPNFKNISQEDLGKALSKAPNLEIFNLILKHLEPSQLTPALLGKALKNASLRKDFDMVKIILQFPNSREIADDDFSNASSWALLDEKLDIFNFLWQHYKDSKELSPEHLGKALINASDTYDIDMVKIFLQFPRSKEISAEHLYYALSKALFHKKLDIFNLLWGLPNSKDLSPKRLGDLIGYCSEKPDILNLILHHPNSNEIEALHLDIALNDISTTLHSDIALNDSVNWDIFFIILQKPNAKFIEPEDLKISLDRFYDSQAIKILNFVSQNPISKELASFILLFFLEKASHIGNIEMVNRILQEPKSEEISSIDLAAAFKKSFNK